MDGKEALYTSAPAASRLHIALFGRRNSGKSSLLNALAGQEVALVSDTAGTTTDPVQKALELYPLGPCLLIDTAGFDDEGPLGALRVERTAGVAEKTDLAILVFTAGQTSCVLEEAWLRRLQAAGKPVIAAINKADLAGGGEGDIPPLARELPHALASAAVPGGVEALREKIIQQAPREFELPSITGHLVRAGDSVLLVAPQDIQAPKGRLILPQVQTLRDLLDLGAVPTIVTSGQLERALGLLCAPPRLIITDSQVFPFVYERCPAQSMLTSFSVLMARYKGDIGTFVEGAAAVDTLTPASRVLVLEACAHRPLDGDIGRVKIPALLRRQVGEGLRIEVRSGADMPADLDPYQLVVHCGGCMFGRAQVLARVARCRAQGVPVTNYGILLARLAGILDKIQL